MTHSTVPELFERIEGTVHNVDGTSHEFQITTDGFSQWGTDHTHLTASWDMLKAIENAVGEFLADEYE